MHVDLFTPLADRAAAGRLTENGMHLTDDGLKEVSRIIAARLGGNSGAEVDPGLLASIREKNRLWFDSWRPANWYFVYGDRVSQEFGKAAGDSPSLRRAFEEHKPLIRALDSHSQALARGEDPPAVPQATPAPFDPAAPLSPEEQLAGFTVAEGFEVNLFACERMDVVKPVTISWDEKGRLLVACSPTYPQPLPGIPPSDYILVLEDSNGDGRADKSLKYAEDLTMVQGVEPGAGGLYVCDFDRILHIRDTNGDGKGDTRKVVLSGFGIGDTHQLVNSITHGPDGSLWFTQGLHAFSRVETPWGLSRLDKAGVWRFDPRTLRLDGYFNGGAAGHNCWGVAFDDHMQIFHKSGDRPHGYYSLPGLIRIGNPDDYHSVATLFQSSPKTTALDFIGTRALPDELQGAALIGGYFGSVVELHKLKDDGSGFSSDQLPRLLTSVNDSFRPVDVSVGPDGAIYIADWFNPVIGHYQVSYADPRRDRSHGRIWRISAKGKDPVKQPDLAVMSAAELLEQLRSPERWTRYQAKRLLFDMSSVAALAAADDWIETLDSQDPQFERLLLEVTGVFEAHHASRPALLARLLAATDPRVRAYGARVAGAWHLRIEDAHGHLQKSANDGHPRVRLEAVVASTHLESPEAVSIALQALDHPRDRFIDYALKHATRSLQPLWEAPFHEGRLALKDPSHNAYLREIATAVPAEEPPGKAIYETLCSNCHQPGGKGLPGVYPPLAAAESIGGDPVRLIKVLLHGLAGSATGTAQTPLPMPPMGLDDQQTADILSYIRSHFGNRHSAVTPDQVKAVREATAGRAALWTVEELVE